MGADRLDASDPAPTLVGVDGCPCGWLYVVDRSGVLDARIVPTLLELLDRLPTETILATDIPIGLTRAGPRTCDRQARRRLGRPRGSSVFPVPVRAARRFPRHTCARILIS